MFIFWMKRLSQLYILLHTCVCRPVIHFFCPGVRCEGFCFLYILPAHLLDFSNDEDLIKKNELLCQKKFLNYAPTKKLFLDVSSSALKVTRSRVVLYIIISNKVSFLFTSSSLVYNYNFFFFYTYIRYDFHKPVS
jgi:hypothetical protein